MYIVIYIACYFLVKGEGKNLNNEPKIEELAVFWAFIADCCDLPMK